MVLHALRLFVLFVGLLVWFILFVLVNWFVINWGFIVGFFGWLLGWWLLYLLCCRFVYFCCLCVGFACLCELFCLIWLWLWLDCGFGCFGIVLAACGLVWLFICYLVVLCVVSDFGFVDFELCYLYGCLIFVFACLITCLWLPIVGFVSYVCYWCLCLRLLLDCLFTCFVVDLLCCFKFGFVLIICLWDGFIRLVLLVWFDLVCLIVFCCLIADLIVLFLFTCLVLCCLHVLIACYFYAVS